MPAVQTANTPNFETVWAALQETSRQMQETDRRMQETDRQMQETDRRMQETDRKIEKTARQIEETDRILKESASDFNRRIGHLDNLFGEVAEYMIAPGLREKFIEFGLEFPKATQNVSVKDKGNNLFFEIDVMLENGDKAMLVEVKTKLTEERINVHIERLEKMRKYANLHNDTRTFLGAVAGVVVTKK